MEFGGLIAAVATSKVDMIAASIYITEERQKQINFSDPYFEMGNRVFALKSNIAAFGIEPRSRSISPRSFFASLADSFHSNIIEEKRYLLIWDGLKTTVILSIFSTVFGTLLGALDLLHADVADRRLLSARGQDLHQHSARHARCWCC